MKDKLKVFVSYRRNDSSGFSGRIADNLSDDFDVFHDIEGIPLGEEFPEFLKQQIKKSDVVLFLIGKNSAKLFTEKIGQKDYVVEEMSLAKKSGSRIIPILLNGATMPNNFPKEIAFIAQHNAYEIRHNHFKQDVSHLKKEIAKSPFKSLVKRVSIFFKKTVALLLMGALAFVAFKWYETRTVDAPVVKKESKVFVKEKEVTREKKEIEVKKVEKKEPVEEKKIEQSVPTEPKSKDEIKEKKEESPIEYYKGKRLYQPMDMVPLKPMKIATIQPNV